MIAALTDAVLKEDLPPWVALFEKLLLEMRVSAIKPGEFSRQTDAYTGVADDDQKLFSSSQCDTEPPWFKDQASRPLSIRFKELFTRANS